MVKYLNLFIRNHIKIFMDNETEIYDIEGYYIQDGRRGEQKGTISLYGDVKIIGEIRDRDDSLGLNLPKVCLGSCESGEIDLLKISIEDERFCPVAWVLSKSGEIDEGLEGIYSGRYILLQGLEGLTLHFGVKNNLRILKDFNIDELKEYFDKVKGYITDQGETGEFSFLKR